MSYRRPSGHRYRPYDDVPKHLRCGACCRRVKMHGRDICAECDRRIVRNIRRLTRADQQREQGSASDL